MVSIICCTMRSAYMDQIFQNYDRQRIKAKEMIIVLNSDDMDIRQWKAEARKYKHVRVYQIPESNKLGACLNFGIRKAKYDILAKFDDDDYYGRYYLRESLKAIRHKAPVVGKHTSYVYFEKENALMLFREGGERDYCRRVKGGTLVFRRSVWDEVKFDERQPNGSDSDFLRRARQAGHRIYSVSKHNYVCVRRSDIQSHTQKTSTKEYMARCKLLRYTKNYVPHTIRRIKSD